MMQGDVFHWKPMSWLFYVVISCFIMLYPHISTVSSLVCDLFKRWELSKADAMPAAETSCPEAADPAPDAKPGDAAWAATLSCCKVLQGSLPDRSHTTMFFVCHFVEFRGRWSRV